jgi:hypothetical protein
MLVAFIGSNAARDLWDYFAVWPRRGMVRLLYRADQRQIAEYLHEHGHHRDIAVGSGLMGPWDRIALTVDLVGTDVEPRLFDPDRALVWAHGTDPLPVFLTTWPEVSDSIDGFLERGRQISHHVSLHSPTSDLSSSFTTEETTFANGLTLLEVRRLEEESETGTEGVSVLTAWRVSEPLDLPPMPVVAQPPPPQTYAGPRLAVFAHLLGDDGQTLDIDDGLWVDPSTLQPGDHFLQVHRFSAGAERPSAASALAIGLYDPKTGERWETMDGRSTGADLVTFRLGETQ